MNAPVTDEDVPKVIPWPEFQKRAEHEGVDVADYITSMNAHILNQRDEINRLRARLKTARNIITDAQNFIGPTTVWRDTELMQRNIRSFLEQSRDQ